MFNAAFAATHSFKPIEKEYTARTSSFMVVGTSEEIMSMIYSAANTMSDDIKISKNTWTLKFNCTSTED